MAKTKKAPAAKTYRTAMVKGSAYWDWWTSFREDDLVMVKRIDKKTGHVVLARITYK